MHGHHKGKYSKHDIAFRGVLTCAYDNLTVTAELKKGKYVYYRCSGYHGKCELPRFREEQISEKLGEVLKGIRIPDDVLARISSSRGDKHAAEMEFRMAMKRRNVSQFKTEKMLETYLGTGADIDVQPQSLLDVYEQGTQDEHIIPNFLLAGQVTILHGHSGSGKSTLMKQASAFVLDFIDSLPGEPWKFAMFVDSGRNHWANPWQPFDEFKV